MNVLGPIGVPEPTRESQSERDVSRISGGPSWFEAAESLANHQSRLGPRPRGGEWLFDVVEQSGLRGHGGAWFPAFRKWQAITSHGKPTVLIVNASESEPLSNKDKTLTAKRPHLLLDGAMLTAETVGADEVVFYVSKPTRKLEHALAHAVRERAHAGFREIPMRVVTTPNRYVSGESSAVIRRVDGGPAKPEFALTRSSRRWVDGHPALVHNAETIAHVGLLGRFGVDWFRQFGTASAPGTALITLVGNVRNPGVYEIALGTSYQAAVDLAGGSSTETPGVLVGGYFGSWVAREDLEDLRLDPDQMTLGCGVLAVLGNTGCPMHETNRIINYLASETAAQCGPCIYGLSAVADMFDQITTGAAPIQKVELVREWCAMIKNRGACNHPDGAVAHLTSVLDAFPQEVERHACGHPCQDVQSFAAPPKRPWWSQ